MSQTNEIKVHVEELKDGVVIRPVGEIEVQNAALFRTQLEIEQKRCPHRLIINLTDVPEIDSSTLAILVEAIGVSRQNNGLLIICGLQERVKAIFEMTRLYNKVFTIVDSIQEAKTFNNRRAAIRFAPKGLKCDLGELLEVSAGGLRLLSKRKMKGTVTLRLWSDVSGLVLQAAVVWTKRIRMRKHESGLEFINLNAETTKELALIIATVSAGNSTLDV